METAKVRRRHSTFAAGLASMAMALGLAAIPAGAAPHPREVDYVAIGDSYTAGTGAVSRIDNIFPPFVPTPPCTQTEGGYVDLVDTVDAVDLEDNAACHGALIRGLSADGARSIVEQIAELASTAKLSRSTELVSLTAGANDVGVSVVLYTCATSAADACAQAVRSAAAAMPVTGAHLVRALGDIHRQAPTAKIVVLGYPRLLNPAGAPVIPVEHQRLVNQGTALLNATIATAAATAKVLYGANVQYMDVTARFAGHEVNSADPWIFFDAAPDANGVLQIDPRSLHPNLAGHQQYAAALLNAVDLKQLARP
jgi:lysophospholipase L1-like esterase